MNWNNYYYVQEGSGDYIYKGTLTQRGYGLGGTFQRFFKWIVPLFQKHAVPALQEGAKELGKKALTTVSNVAKDAAEGKNVLESAKSHVNTAIEDLATKIEEKLENKKGRGLKKKLKPKKFKKYIILKKQKVSDIFQNDD